jgi:polyhydroxyalkanoate synthesis regulator phasin
MSKKVKSFIKALKKDKSLNGKNNKSVTDEVIRQVKMKTKRVPRKPK